MIEWKGSAPEEDFGAALTTPPVICTLVHTLDDTEVCDSCSYYLAAKASEYAWGKVSW